MPQFDFSNYISQVFWFVIAFSILYSFINFWFVPRISKSLLDRRRYISDIENRVSDMRVEIDKLSKDYEVKLSEVKKQCDEYRDSEIAKHKLAFDKKYKNQILDFNLKIKDQEKEFNLQLNGLKEELDKNLILIIGKIVSRYKIDIPKEEIVGYIKELDNKNGI